MNQYDELLRLIIEKPTTIVVYNEKHLNNLRAGLSRAKRKYEVNAEFLGLEDISTKRFTYTSEVGNVYKVTISLKDSSGTFKVILADPSDADPSDTESSNYNDQSIEEVPKVVDNPEGD